ncbi:MAG TPA: PEP-CTERM sorting domain-containing protein [Povalibacter sp.]|nr:PEP-CTERM sorting domain-containing protein [Povalibacter sp.]
MERPIPRGLLIALLIFPAVAGAIPVQSSTGTFVTMRDCVGPAGNCSLLSPIVSSAYGGSPGEAFAGASLVSPIYGTATASSALSGAIGAPILRIATESEDGRRVNTNTFALQRYVYTGTTATTRTFGGTLSYSQLITDPNNPSYGTAASGINAELRVFSTAGAFAEAGTTAQSNNDLLFAFSHSDGAADFSLLGEDLFNDQLSNPAGLATFSISVALNPGDAVWVWAFLQTPAADGSFVDASHTFLTGWDDIADLIPANVYQVPEPGTLVLFCLGVALLSWQARRGLAVPRPRPRG